jgi:DNA-binding NarL/FixJ family response regulator
MNATEPVPTLIVEDTPETRARFVEIVRRHPDLRLVAAVGTLTEARHAAASLHPRVVLLDLGLPDGSGIALIRELVGRGDAAETLVISVMGDEASVLDAIEAGAGGYLLKDASESEIIGAVHQLLDGGAPLSPSIAVHLMRRLKRPPAATAPLHAEPSSRLAELNEREIEMLRMIAKGLSYEEVAQALGLRWNTVASYAKGIYRKLQVHGRTEAAFEAVQLGLVRGVDG